MLSIDFNICMESDCTTFTLYETTGTYSATNTGGWGAPNPLTSDMTSAILQVKAPDGTISNINLLTLGFPSSNPSFSYDFLASTVGDYEDGKWEFLLYYSDGVTTYQKKHNRLFYCTTQCCIDTMIASVVVEDCNCCEADTTVKRYLKAKVFLDALKNAARCFQTDNFTAIKAILDRICANSGCNICK